MTEQSASERVVAYKSCSIMRDAGLGAGEAYCQHTKHSCVCTTGKKEEFYLHYYLNRGKRRLACVTEVFAAQTKFQFDTKSVYMVVPAFTACDVGVSVCFDRGEQVEADNSWTPE